jgi:hypothetical protein
LEIYGKENPKMIDKRMVNRGALIRAGCENIHKILGELLFWPDLFHGLKSSSFAHKHYISIVNMLKG